MNLTGNHSRSFVASPSRAGLAATLALAASLLVGCSSTQKAPARTISPVVQGTSASESVMVSSGQLVTVRLPVQAGSGYAWRMTPSSKQNNMMLLQDKSIEQPGVMNPGAQEWNVFTFKAQRSGQVMLTFLCDRPYDSAEIPSAKRFELTVMAE